MMESKWHQNFDDFYKEYYNQVYFDKDFVTRLLIANQDIFKPLLFEKLSKNNLDNTLIRTTTAFTMQKGSNSANAIPQVAQVTADFRILPTDTPMDVEEHINDVLSKKLPNIKYSIETISAQAPSKVSLIDSNEYKILESEIKYFFPSALVVPYMVPAGTDARNYEKLSDCIYRFLPISLTPEEYALMHGVNENISIENYMRMIKFYESLIKNNF